MVVTFEDVSFKYLEKKLLDKVSFSFTDDVKLGVIGLNGSGKTTLVKLIMGEEVATSGTITKSGGMIINYLPQNPVFPKTKTILEIIMESSTLKHPINDYEAKAILNKLNLPNHNMLIDKMSGGEIKRLALAKVLVSYCDILILDEPTNHLDNDLIIWLEKYLIKFKKGLFMITHDRYFLQRVCNRMLEIDNGKIYIYEANYDKFLELKAKRMELEEKANQKLKAVLKKEAFWLSRGVEARRTKSKSRIARFNELSKTNFKEEKTMAFTSLETYLGKQLIEIENVTKAFGDKILFQDFSFQLQRHDIVGVVGPNGSGKTTLFKILMNEEKLDKGNIKLGQTLRIGYLPQKLAEKHFEIRVIDYLKEEYNVVDTLNGRITINELLDQFLFDDNLKYAKLSTLSGGELRRLELVRVLGKNPNLLILDEPTNDLDIFTIELLENFLESFNGPILVVSHDRYFLDKLCNKLLVYEAGTIKEYGISFSEFLSQEHQIQGGVKEKIKNNRGLKVPASLRNEYQRLEEEIAILEAEIKVLNEEKQGLTTEYLKLIEYEEKIAAKMQRLDNCINRYLDLEEIIAGYKN